MMSELLNEICTIERSVERRHIFPEWKRDFFSFIAPWAYTWLAKEVTTFWHRDSRSAERYARASFCQKDLDCKKSRLACGWGKSIPIIDNLTACELVAH